jgi:hypothetical protein
VGQGPGAGVDARKQDHHCVVIDSDGQRQLSQKGVNDEAGRWFISAVWAPADGGQMTWATDLNRGGAALLIRTRVFIDD